MSNDDYRCPDFPQSPTQPPQYTCADVYTVQTGDTLYSIAQAYGIPVAALMQCNRILNPYNLKPGIKLCIPGTEPEKPNKPVKPSPNPAPLPTPPMPDAPACSGTLHTIVEGDTLYMIAKKYRVPLAIIMRANPNIDPYNLRIGQQLCIPSMGPDGETGGNGGSNGGNNNNSGGGRPQPPACSNGTLYRTQRGDTLTRIMDRFGVTYEELKQNNPEIDFSDSLESLTLCIPRKNSGDVSTPDDCYIVVKGDNLEIISLKLLVISDSLLIANPTLTIADFCVPGTQINIPK